MTSLREADKRLKKLAPRSEPIVYIFEWVKGWGTENEEVVETTEVVSWPGSEKNDIADTSSCTA